MISTRSSRRLLATRVRTNAVSAPEKVFSAADFNDSEGLYNHAKEYIKATPPHEELVYTEAPKG